MKGIAQNPAVDIPVYRTPQCIIVDICTEGILCFSGVNTGGYHDGIDGDDTSII